jgi:hypothetical protein
VEDVIRLRPRRATLEWIDRVNKNGQAPTIDDLIRLREEGAQ